MDVYIESFHYETNGFQVKLSFFFNIVEKATEEELVQVPANRGSSTDINGESEG